MKAVRRPVIPLVDVNVGPTNTRFFDSNDDVVFGTGGVWTLLQRQTTSFTPFDESVHCSRHYITGPIRHGTNSLCPSRSAHVRSPDATRNSRSKISLPTSGTPASPSAIRPALMSMLSRMRSYV